MRNYCEASSEAAARERRAQLRHIASPPIPAERLPCVGLNRVALRPDSEERRRPLSAHLPTGCLTKPRSDMRETTVAGRLLEGCSTDGRQNGVVIR